MAIQTIVLFVMIYIIFAIFVAVALCRAAPLGWEDSRGFNFGVQDQGKSDCRGLGIPDCYDPESMATQEALTPPEQQPLNPIASEIAQEGGRWHKPTLEVTRQASDQAETIRPPLSD
jgi:hypothetical protein